MTTQRQVKMLVKKYGEQRAVEIIKTDPKRFPNIQNYPEGVRVFLDYGQPVESILVGKYWRVTT